MQIYAPYFSFWYLLQLSGYFKNAKIKVAVSVDKQRTLIRIYMEKYISVRR